MLASFRRRAFVALTAPTLVAACHSYVPVASAPAQGARVSAELTDQGVVEMARWVGPGVTTIEGRLIGVSDSALTLGVLLVRKRSGIEEYWVGEPVPIPRALIGHLGEQRLSRPRTALFSSAITLGVAALAVIFAGANGGTSSGDGTGGGGSK